MNKHLLMTALPVLLAGLAVPPALAAGDSDTGQTLDQRAPAASGAGADTGDLNEARMDAQELVDDAAAVAQQMKQDEDVGQLLQQAKGVVIMPKFGKAAVIVGGEGGEGLLVAREGTEWSEPVFYNLGGVSIGAQAGVEAGAVGMLLMSQDAVDAFKQDNNFELNANAELSIVNYSAKAQGNIADYDVVMWSDTEGLLAGLSVGGSDVTVDKDQNQAYYGKPATPTDILNGTVTNPNAKSLQNSLPKG